MIYRCQNQDEGRILYDSRVMISSHINRIPKNNYIVQKYKESFLKHTTFVLGLVG